MYGWMDGLMDACMYVCMHACMHACMCVEVCVCVHLFVHVFVHLCRLPSQGMLRCESERTECRRTSICGFAAPGNKGST